MTVGKSIFAVDSPRGTRAGRSGSGRANWVTSWAASIQGPYPVGNPSAQPDLSRVFPSPAVGARDQSFRLIIKPELWGRQMRLRFSNAFGTQPVSFDGVFAGLQWSGSALLPQSNRPITFGMKPGVTLVAGESIWSDALALPYVTEGGELRGRKLAVSFHVVGDSGPMSWHAKALQTSYVTRPGAGAKGHELTESAFPFPTTSWYFIDALDMDASKGSGAIVAFGDSLTDGTASTLNGDDRWPDVLARRLAGRPDNRLVVVNAGIGGNQIVGPHEYSALRPFPGGPSALQRLDRDVLSLSGVRAVLWLEGINDFGLNGNAEVKAVIAGLCAGLARIRAALPGVRVIGATLPSALGSNCEGAGFVVQDQKRRELNEFIRSSDLFDGLADFDHATLDPRTGAMNAEFVPNTTLGGPGDGLHPNRLGYQAMGSVIDLGLFEF